MVLVKEVGERGHSLDHRSGSSGMIDLNPGSHGLNLVSHLSLFRQHKHFINVNISNIYISGCRCHSFLTNMSPCLC